MILYKNFWLKHFFIALLIEFLLNAQSITLLFLYLFYFLIRGEKGILSYYKILKKYSLVKEELIVLDKKNKEIEDKISRLSPNTLDLDYLDEQLRKNNGKIAHNEMIISLD